ncbi:MAG: glycosyltransferase family 4 protein [Methanogenium sp.]|jgi:glycosyltransferase involved in cell wall biosynthesis
MRIAQVCPRYYPAIGGVETIVKNISEQLITLGHTVDVITTDPTGRLPESEVINGVNVIRFKSFAPHEAFYIAPQIAKYFTHHKYGVIHAHNYHALPAFYASMGNKDSGFVFSPYYHGSAHTTFRNLLMTPYRVFGQHIFDVSTHVICISKCEAKLVERDFEVKNKIDIIPPGIDISDYIPREPDEHLLLYVGRLEEYKGVQYIVEALVNMPEYQLCIIGSGPYEAKLRALAIQVGVGNRIQWLHNIPRSELVQYYSRAGAAIMLSSHESFGISVAEALAFGVPCVVVDNENSALGEFIDHKSCFGVVYPNDIISLIDAIQYAAKHKKVERIQQVDWQSTVRNIYNVYREAYISAWYNR